MSWRNSIKSGHWTLKDFTSAGQISHLSRLLGGILKAPVQMDNLTTGAHFIFNNQLNECVGSDGYDNYQAPVENGKQLFNRRMWVGGSIQWHGKGEVNGKSACEETIRTARLLNNQMFVSIDRDFIQKGRVLTENRVLMYTNEVYKSTNTDTITKIIDSNSNDTPRGTQSKDIIFSGNDTLKYSCLSYNLHKIHYDLQHCLSEGLPNIIVQGPLIVTVSLTFVKQLFPTLTFNHFQYKNVHPVEIDAVHQLKVTKLHNSIDICMSRNGSPCFTGTLVI